MLALQGVEENQSDTDDQHDCADNSERGVAGGDWNACSHGAPSHSGAHLASLTWPRVRSSCRGVAVKQPKIGKPFASYSAPHNSFTKFHARWMIGHTPPLAPPGDPLRAGFCVSVSVVEESDGFSGGVKMDSNQPDKKSVGFLQHAFPKLFLARGSGMGNRGSFVAELRRAEFSQSRQPERVRADCLTVR